MDEDALRSLLAAVREGAVHPDDAVRRLRAMPFADLGFARVDHHRALRQGRAEAIYGPGKSAAQINAILGELLSRETGPVVVSRIGAEVCAEVHAAHPEGAVHGDPSSYAGATIVYRPIAVDAVAAPVVIASAGTADLPVSDVCATVLDAHGVRVVRLNDVGVAGLHRLLDSVEVLQSARAVVVVAGMEGALASVVGGLVGAPVVAVPTSVGYGSGLDGVTALLSMTASCASGITVVGIDNGFGAANAVLRIIETFDHHADSNVDHLADHPVEQHTDHQRDSTSTSTPVDRTRSGLIS